MKPDHTEFDGPAGASSPGDFSPPGVAPHPGLQFDCTRGQRCCRVEPGYVFLSAADLQRLADHFALTPQQVRQKYTRMVHFGGISQVSLTEQTNYDCVFWADGGCTVYPARPLQCRSFPFWEDNIASQNAWEAAAADCPGIGRGPVHTFAEIDYWRGRRIQEPPIDDATDDPGDGAVGRFT